MKKAIIIAVAALALFTGKLNGQPAEGWPVSSSAVSLYAGTIIMATPVVVTFDHLLHRKRSHFGISAGITTSLYEGAEWVVLGGYAALTFLSGARDHHFEARLGASYLPIQLYPDAWEPFEQLPFVPVITLGYRYQEPGGNRFYRVSIGTGGIGFGIGVIFHQKQIPTPG